MRSMSGVDFDLNGAVILYALLIPLLIAFEHDFRQAQLSQVK